MRLKATLLIFIALTLFLGFPTIIPSTHAADPSIIVRDDGLTVVTPPKPVDNKEAKKDSTVNYLTMIVKTGYGHDPAGKVGLTHLTNNLLYMIFLYYTPSADVSYETYGDYTVFHFVTHAKDAKAFFAALDEILRTEVLFGYDFCNSWREYVKNASRHPGLPALTNLSAMLYGADHPYTKTYAPDYDNLNVGELNKWFRRIYRPNNMIISSTAPIPEDFLRRPAGKEFKAPVGLPPIAQPVIQRKTELRYVADYDHSSVICMGFPSPKLSDGDYMGLNLGWLYLADALEDELRGKSGYVYYVSPYSTAGEEPSAPAFIVIFQTLPEETGIAAQKAMEVLKELAKNGIPQDKLARILDSEKKKLALRDKSAAALTRSYAYRALFGIEWFGDSEAYLKHLEQAAPGVAKVFADRLPYLKLSIAGPEGVEETLKVIDLE